MNEQKPFKEKVFELLIDNNSNTKAESRREAIELLEKHLIKTYNFKTIKQDEKEEIWGYQNGIYVSYGKSLIKEFLKLFLGNGYNLKFANDIISHIMPLTYIDAKTFFGNNYPYLLPVNNGILDLNTGELKDYDKKLIFFTKLPIDYNPNAECPNIIKHFQDVLKDKKDITLLQECIGNCLVKEYKYNKAVMMNGKGRNGKGVTLDLINNLLGIENVSSISLQNLEENQYAEANLFGKLANTAGDINKTALKSTGKFKQLTGGDLMTAERKFMTPLYFINYAKFFFACNELPEVYDQSYGFMERWNYFDFPFTFLSQERYNNTLEEERENLKIENKNIKDELFTKEELEGFLIFAYNGFKRLYENRGYSYSKTNQETLNLWLTKSNSAMGFCYELLDKDFTKELSVQEVQQIYNNYCEETEVLKRTPRDLNKAIYESLGIVKKQKKVNGDIVYIYPGLTFKSKQNEVEHIEVI